jgi:hypothetical protein
MPSSFAFMTMEKVETNKTMSNVMYLPKDVWSPRYDSTFFTIKLVGKQLLSEPPEGHQDLGGRVTFPAYFYEIVVFQEHTKKSLQRRYSEFKWLYDQVSKSPPTAEEVPNAEPIHMPPGTCPFQWQNEAFAQNRLESLSEFMSDLLERPGYAAHPAVVRFLDLGASDS